MGYLYKKKRRKPDGSTYIEPVWWMKYYRNGQEFRESTRTEDYNDAKTALKLAEGTVARQEPIISGKIRFSEMLDAVVQDYVENQRKDLSHTESRIKNHIKPFFGRLKPVDITPRVLAKYREKRRKQGASAGTVNRELSIMGKAFTVSGLPYRPKIEKLRERNVRKGFVSRTQLETIKKHLSVDVADLIEFLFLSGWRKSEVINLQWHNINFDRQEVTLEQFTTKNDRPRCFPMFADLHSLLSHRRQITDQVERKKKTIIPWVFHRNGFQIRDFRKAWEIGTEKAKLSGILIHDLRRSAIKVWTEKGISEQIGMELAGHRTPSIYRRYNIVTSDDLKNAVSKLETGPRKAARGTISGTERGTQTKKS